MTVSKARVLVAPNSGKSMVGRGWLVALRSGECKVGKKPVKGTVSCEISSEICSAYRRRFSIFV